MALKEVRDIRNLLSETKTPQPPIVVLFPEDMYKFVKYNNGEGAYTLRFDNGLGAKVFFECGNEGDRIAMYEVRWSPTARFLDDCTPSNVVLPMRTVPKTIEELNGLLETIRNHESVIPERMRGAAGLSISSTGMSIHSRGSTGTGFIFDSETSTWVERPVVEGVKEKWTVSGAWSPLDPTQYTVTYAPPTASATTTTTTASPSKVLKWEDPA